MKTSILSRTISIALSIMVVFSTFSFTVEKHYCGGKIVDISVFSEADKCGMDMIFEAESANKSCCKDQIDILKGQDELKTNTDTYVTTAQVLFLKTLIYSSNLSFQGLSKEVIPHKNYSPPNIIKDIHLLDEVFLI